MIVLNYVKLWLQTYVTFYKCCSHSEYWGITTNNAAMGKHWQGADRRLPRAIICFHFWLSSSCSSIWKSESAAAATASNGANAYPYDVGDSAAAEMATNGANALDECVVGSYEVVDDGAIYVGRQLDLLNYWRLTIFFTYIINQFCSLI